VVPRHSFRARRSTVNTLKEYRRAGDAIEDSTCPGSDRGRFSRMCSFPQNLPRFPQDFPELRGLPEYIATHRRTRTSSADAPGEGGLMPARQCVRTTADTGLQVQRTSPRWRCLPRAVLTIP
jgi:hypothetical protein